MAALALAVPAAAAALEPPVVTLVYPAPDGTVFDRTCPMRFKIPVERAWVDETLRRRDELQALWDRDGAPYLKVVLREVGRPFPYRDMPTTLTVCTEESLGMPLMVNTRAFLSGAANPDPIELWPRLVFHEIMHTYTEPLYGVSPLMRKHRAEGAHALNHLHVLALERLVLEKLGKTRELALLDHEYRVRAPAAYRRAWEIVDAEGVQAFVDELKAHLPRETAAQRAAKRSKR